MKKIILIFLAILFFVALGWLGYKYFTAEQPVNQLAFPPVPVTVVEVKFDKIYDHVEAIGSSIANEAAIISSNVSEVVEEIKFIENQFVKQGEELLILSHAEELAQKNIAQLQLAEHQRELARLANLLDKQAEFLKLYDERATQLQISQQNIIEIEARIADRIIKAPFDGVLGLRDISVGSLILPGDVITTIDDLSEIKVDFTIPSVYMDNIEYGTEVIVKTDATGRKNFEGYIAFIDSRVDPLTRAIKMRAIVKNAAYDLKPGLLIRVSILKNAREALIIPEQAIIHQHKQHFILAVDAENRVSKKPIVIGTRLHGKVEVINGLTAGEKIITEGLMMARPGAMVDIRN
mgnify:CR=1 FL=1